jgi:hypothetical protein
LNSFYDGKFKEDDSSSQYLETLRPPIIYKGFSIFHRIQSSSSGGNCFVKDVLE